ASGVFEWNWSRFTKTASLYGNWWTNHWHIHSAVLCAAGLLGGGEEEIRNIGQSINLNYTHKDSQNHRFRQWHKASNHPCLYKLPP
ncbi:MAG: hypothetical protein ACJASR_002371, partial [Psychroserpens sp.]